MIQKDFLYIIISKVFWIACGFVIHVVLGRYLGPKLYGIYGVILALISVIYIVVGNGVRQAITKYTANDLELVGAIKTAGLRIQTLFSLIIGTAYFCFSGPIAALLRDSTLTNYIKLSALTIPLTGIAFVYVGSLEGIRRFKASAVIAVVYAFLKITFIFLLVLLGLKVYGVIIGLILSVLFAALVGGYFCRGQSNKGHFDSAVLIKFGFPVLLFFIAIALLTYIDILFVKSILADNAKTGFYTSARTISQIIYFIFSAFSIVLLPSVSSAIASADLQLTKRYINQSLRYMLMLLIPTALMISATSAKLVTLFYGRAYIAAAYPLSILVFGMSFLVVTLALSTIMQGYGKPRTPLTILSILVPVNVCLHLLMIPRFQLLGAALATSITCFIGLAISCIYVYKEFKTLLSLNSLFKIILASVVIYLIALRISFSHFLLPIYYVGLFSLYFFVLLILKEINYEDMSFLKEILSSPFRKQAECEAEA